jgi:hypothetical protein
MKGMALLSRTRNRQILPRVTHFIRFFGLLLSGTVVLFFGLGISEGKELVTIGEVEEVVLLPWGIKLLARIDTGAATSSLDARDLKVTKNVAEFKLPEKYGDLQLKLPILEWRGIRSADAREQRPVVEITLCMGPRKIRAQVTLNDRSGVRYPLVIGRNVLRKNFVVDCTQSNCLPPSCPETPTP